MYSISRRIIFFILTFIFSGSGVFAQSGYSGWPIFNKIQSSQFKAISATSPGYSDLSSVLYNPAVAGTHSSKEFLFISELGFAEDKLGAAFFRLPAGKGMISLGGGYYDAGTVELNWLENGAITTESVSLSAAACSMSSSPESSIIEKL